MLTLTRADQLSLLLLAAIAPHNAVDSTHPEFRQVSGLVKQTKVDTAQALATLVGGRGG